MPKDIVLSKRLKAVASMVDSCDTFTDIGTDHALLPLWLIMHNVCGMAIAADINEGPLRSARSNAASYGIGNDRITFVLSDGLRSIEDPREGCNTLAITGMGGLNITGILKNGAGKTGSYSSFIFSPHTKQAELRKYLINKDFMITDEKYVLDDEKLYVIIKAVPSGSRRNTDVTDYSETDYRFGRFIDKALGDDSIRDCLYMSYGRLCKTIGDSSSIPQERLAELYKEVQSYKEVLGI